MSSNQSFDKALIVLTIIEAIIKIAQMQLYLGASLNVYKEPQCNELHRTKFGTLAS